LARAPEIVAGSIVAAGVIVKPLGVKEPVIRVM
jgi:hypothetical protein